jgi:hypothetical protein
MKLSVVESEPRICNVNRKGDSVDMNFGPICDGRDAKTLAHTSPEPIHLARRHVAQCCALRDLSPKHDEFSTLPIRRRMVFLATFCAVCTHRAG